MLCVVVLAEDGDEAGAEVLVYEVVSGEDEVVVPAILPASEVAAAVDEVDRVRLRYVERG